MSEFGERLCQRLHRAGDGDPLRRSTCGTGPSLPAGPAAAAASGCKPHAEGATPLGEDFAGAIAAAAGSCAVLLALIGTQWLTVTDAHGRRRLDDPADFVRLEIEAALARGILVIPVIMEGTRMPGAAQLPASLRELTRRQARELRPARFDSDTEHLLKALDRALGGMPVPLARTAGSPYSSSRPRVLPLGARWSAAAVLAAAAAVAAGIYVVPSLRGPSASSGGSTYGGHTTPTAPTSHAAIPGTPIPVGSKPDWIAIASGGKTAYVANGGDATTTPINLVTGTRGTPIRVGNRPYRIAITPDGRTAYVTNQGDNTLTPIDLMTGTAGRPSPPEAARSPSSSPGTGRPPTSQTGPRPPLPRCSFPRSALKSRSRWATTPRS